MHHLNQSIKDEAFEKVIITFGDIGFFVCAIYYFNRGICWS